MKVVLSQEHPHPVFDVEEFSIPKDFNVLLDWLHRKDLPEDLSLAFEGTMYRFRTRTERVQFALGFDRAFDLLDDEPELPFHRDFDNTAYYQLGNGDNQQALEEFCRTVLQELFLSAWPEHANDVKVYASSTCSVLIRREVWVGLSLRQKHSLVDRCHGYCDALHSVYTRGI